MDVTKQEIQAMVAQALAEVTIPHQLNVVTPQGIADIVTDTELIQCQPCLTCGTIFLTLAQALSYASKLHRPYVHVIGLAPRNLTHRRAAIQLREIAEDRLKITFLDVDNGLSFHCIASPHSSLNLSNFCCIVCVNPCMTSSPCV
jgi:hypothetical protein